MMSQGDLCRQREAEVALGAALSMTARVGSSATTTREPRQARKGAAVTVMSGAGGVLARVVAISRGLEATGQEEFSFPAVARRL